MGRRRCCCGDCLVGEDNFDRTASTDMGSKWNEVGEWEISNNEATGTGTLLTTYRTGGSEIVVYVKPKHLRTGFSWRVIVAYEDEDNYLFSQFTANDEIGGYTVGLWSRIEGVEVEIESETSAGFSEGQTWYTCYSPEVEFSTGLPQSDLWITECQSGTCAAGIQPASVGLSIPAQPESGDKLAFDDFQLYRHNSWRADCPFCDCHCQEPDQKAVCLPEELTLVLHNIYGCSGLDGKEITLTQKYTAKTKWETIPGGVELCPGSSQYLFANLTCTQGQYELTLVLSAGSSWSFDDPLNGTFVTDKIYKWALASGDAGYACDPLQLTYPLFTLTVVSECEPQPCCTDPSCGYGYNNPNMYPEVTL